MNDLNYSTDVEYETKDKKKFQITRGMVILAILALIILITVIVIIVVTPAATSTFWTVKARCSPVPTTPPPCP